MWRENKNEFKEIAIFISERRKIYLNIYVLNQFIQILQQKKKKLSHIQYQWQSCVPFRWKSIFYLSNCFFLEKFWFFSLQTSLWFVKTKKNYLLIELICWIICQIAKMFRIQFDSILFIRIWKKNPFNPLQCWKDADITGQILMRWFPILPYLFRSALAK